MESEKLKSALSEHQQGHLDLAESEYLAIINEDSENADALHLLAILYGQKDQFDTALPYVERALKISPTSASYHNSMGNIQKNLGHTDDAIHHYKQALQLAPHSLSALNNIASIYLSQENFTNAIEYYQQALQLNPDFLDTNYNLALTYFRQKNHEQAKKYFQTVCQLDSKHFQSLGMLGNIAMANDLLEDAISLFKQSIRLYDQDVEILVNYAAALIKKGSFEQAITYLNQAILLDPKHYEAHYNIGCAYLNQHNAKAALPHFLQILSSEPNPEVYYNIGVIYMYQDHFSEAIMYLQEAVKYQPDYLDAIINLGVTYLKMGHHDKAIESFKKALAIQPNNTEVHYILSALQGNQSVKQAPDQYVSHLFDQYAPYYDKHLTEFLHYETHTLIHKALKEVLSDQLHDMLIIDLGCGTGLTGALLKPHASKLIGIDLSAKMVEAAGKKDIYDDLHIANIHTTLKSINNADLIVAGDVLSYLGDLAETFELTHTALKDKHYFAFSVELHPEEQPDYILQKTARFKHSRSYIENLCQQYHFNVMSQKEVTLRTQNNQPVAGVIFVLQSKTNA